MSTIITEIANGVALIKLNRPDKFHAFNRDMALSLQATLDACEKDDAVRCIVLTAEGKAFCSGQDLSEAMDANGPGIATIVEEHYNQIIKRLRYIEKPIIAAVNGIAAGAGANVALAADIVLASKSATFIQAFSKIGLIPDSAGTFILPRLIGWQRATALMFTADTVTADEAVQMGMIYKSFNDDEFMPQVMQMATKLANMPTQGIGLTKRLMNESAFNTIDKQLAREGEVQTLAAETHDHKEGIKAFLEKRKPVFNGK